jgi:hypothetical protein
MIRVKENDMQHKNRAAIGSRFKISWAIMVFLAAVSAAGHLALLFFESEPVLFLGWLIFNLYALAVLWFPFRGGERWAWASSWLFVTPYASLIFFDSRVGLYYLVIAAIFAVCLLLTAPAFFRDQPARQLSTE